MHTICITEDLDIIEMFRKEFFSLSEQNKLSVFAEGRDAFEWAKKYPVKTAILDVELLGIHAMGLALRLKELHPNIFIVFARICDKENLTFWGLGSNGYMLNPYTIPDLMYKLMERDLSSDQLKSVIIETIPRFSVTVDGNPLHLSREKVRELFALLVDCGGRGITTKEAISYLWPERPNDSNTQALFRVTFKRLMDVLRKAEIDFIISSEGNHRFLKVKQVDCDLYRIFSGDAQAAKKYDGKYLQEYSWAEERNGQLHRMLISNK